MSTRREEILLAITGDSSGGERSLSRIQKALGPLKQKMEQVSKAGRFMAATFGVITAAGAKLIQSTSKVAMRNEVLAVSLYTVGERAGFTRYQLDGLVQGVKDMGITTSNARLSLTRMIQSQLDLSKATDLARTAQDLAVISGDNSSVAYGKIMDSISALQPRLLRQFGIVSTVNQILGDLSTSTDTAAKRNRFMNFILEEGTKVAGVYESAMGVVGKQIASLPRYIEEAKDALGKHFIPIIGKGVEILKFFLTAFQSLPEGVQRGLAHLILFVTALSGLLATVGGVAAVLPFFISGLSSVAAVLAPLLPYILAIGAALAALGAAMYVLYRAWVEDWGGIRTAVEEAWAKIRPLVVQLTQLVRQWANTFRQQVGQIWAAVKGLLMPLFDRLGGLIRSINWSDMFATFRDAINVAGRYISALLDTIRGLLQGEGFAAFKPLHGAMVDVLTLIALTWQNYISRALTWGYNLVVQAANGIMRAAQTVLAAVMRAIGNIIGRFLAPGSPPKEGPLSKIAEWGKGVFATYLRSFGLADFGILRDVLSPLKSALESALAMGDIDESQFVNIYSTVREQVAGLIASFRETGEISEEMLGQIAAALGEGSEEYIKYLRLTLEHQKALDNLKAVQEEYTKAEAKGFVSKELKEKLAAAEDEAEAAEEAVAWQQEYLAMQQDSIDLQQQLASVLSGLAGSMDDMADAAEKMGSGMGDIGGAEGFDLGDLTDPTTLGSVDAFTAKLGVMSDEFVEMRGRVEAGLAAFQEWLGLPIDEKLSTLFGWLTDITGVDFAGFWQTIQDLLADLDEQGWAEVLGNFLVRAIQLGIQLLMNRAGEFATDLVGWMGGIIEGLLSWVAEDSPNWGTNLAYWVGAAMGRLLELLTVKIPEWVVELIAWLADIIGQLLDWFANDAPRLGYRLWKNFAVALGAWLDHMWTNIPIWLGKMIEWAADIMSQFVAGFLENAPDWLKDLVEVGSWIVQKIIDGLDDNWYRLLQFVKDLLKKLRDLFGGSEPKDPTSPLRGMARSGRALADSFQSGIDFSRVQATLRGQLATIRAEMGALGDVTVHQNFEGGLNFPGVTSGRDAGGVRGSLDRRALQASMMARTGGV